MTSSDYYQFCDNLWRDWVDGKSVLDGPLSERFLQRWCPEPYLKFGTSTDPIYFLFTNPGAGQPHHELEHVFRSSLALEPGMPYGQIAQRLADWYARNANNTAKRRFQAMQLLQQGLGKSSIVQFELIPFHSKSLPGKRKLLELIPASPPLCDYHQRLRNELQDLSVIGLAAVGTAESISKRSLLNSPWLRWQVEIMGLDPTRLEFEPLVEKGRKTTSGFAFSHARGRASGIVLMMGTNSFPGKGGLEKIAGIMETHSIAPRPRRPPNHSPR